MTEQEKKQLTELCRRIEFLRNGIDPDIIIGQIERELEKITDFSCKYITTLSNFENVSNYWWELDKFSYNCNNLSPFTYGKDKLQALYAELVRVTKD